MYRFNLIVCLLILSAGGLSAQTVFVPGGSVGTSSTSNTGIGTSSPEEALQVAGNVLLGGNQAFIARYNGTDDYRGHFQWDHLQLGNNGINYIVSGNSVAGGSLGFVVNNTNDLTGLYAANNTNGTVAMTITSGGYVGIGTTTPSFALHSKASGGPAIALTVETDQSEAYLSLKALGTSSYSSCRIGVTGEDLLFLTNGATERMRVNGLGNVGIGTTSPSHKLSVNGTIKSKEVIVETTGWADHVLRPNYRLPSLSEVQAHINTHGTLPGMPSEADVAGQGISLGDMQAKLLAKIEELTLHQIAQERRIQELTARLKGMGIKSE